MTTLIRQSGEAIERISWRLEERAPGPSPEQDPRILALEHEVNDLRVALSQLQNDSDRAAEEARAQGRKEAQAAFTRDEAERIALLKAAIDTAAKRAEAQLVNLDALALVLCETALENAFDRAADFRDLLTRAIAKQLNGLRREMVIAVYVSPLDFADDLALEALRGTRGFTTTEIKSDQALCAGECRIDLRLGHIEISLPRYWRELKAKLLSAAAEAPS